MVRAPRNEFEKSAVAKADEIGHPVEPETREKASDVEAEHYEGMCEGGPMDGIPGQSRFPRGFVVIDQPDSRAWVYDYDPARNVFISRQKDIHDRIRHLHAAEGSNYDIRAFDRDLMRGDLG